MTDGAARFTVVSFHAHPDDEALYTGGTLARLAAEGHRVVLVVATAGERGLAASEFGDGDLLGQTRVSEVERSARVLGVQRIEFLAYADSGFGVTIADRPFAKVDVDEAAARLAEILTDERADVLTVYDERGGYGHADHVQVHRVGTRAAAMAGTPVVMEATVDRDHLLRLAPIIRLVQRLRPRWQVPALDDSYTPRDALTHRVDVGAYAANKRAALAAHASQAGGSGESRGSGGSRTVGLMLRIPMPVFRRLFRYEWFTEQGRVPRQPLLDDLFASLRTTAR